MNIEEVFELASRPILERIATDRARASEKIVGLLEVLETSLYHQVCNVNYLKLKAKVQDNSIVIQFHSEMGIAPKQYIDSCRMDTARALLENSTLWVWQISDLLDYSKMGVFSKSFEGSIDREHRPAASPLPS
jgi:transcriptional regulator GlxA family with amidase domain